MPITSQSQSFEEDAITLSLFLAAARKSWGLLLAIVETILVATTFFTLRQKRIYQSNATAQIDPNPVRPLGKDVQGVMDIGTGAYWSNQEYYNTQYKIIQSAELCLNNGLKLYSKPPEDARSEGKPSSVELARGDPEEPALDRACQGLSSRGY